MVMVLQVEMGGSEVVGANTGCWVAESNVYIVFLGCMLPYDL